MSIKSFSKKPKKMKTNRIKLIILSVLFAATACVDTYIENPDDESNASNNNSTGIDTVAVNNEIAQDTINSNWDSLAVQNIEIKDESIIVEGVGALVTGNTITITTAGTYSISGTLSNGQVIVNAEDTATVHLILNNATISNSSGVPMNIVSCDKTILVLAENSINTITDESSEVASTATDVPNAAIYSKSDMTITGNGKLVLTSKYNDGITCKDGLIIQNPNLEITAADDGIRGKDYLVVKSGSININAGGDGLKSDNDTDSSKGFIAVETGTVTITSAGDAFAAQNYVLISDGIFDLTSGGGSSKSASSTVSSKGIKGVGNVVINGGTFTLNCADDAIHSNGNVVIGNGTYSIATADDGIHADSTLTFNGGDVTISKSYEGIESAIITLNKGTIHLTSSDDGLNCASGTESGGMGGMGGGFPGQTASGNNYLYVRGGYLYMNAGGDGVDVNGSVEMSGGTIIVDGPTAKDNGPLDYDGTFNLSGGFVVAVGSSGMSMAPSTSSTQYSLLINFTSSQQNGTLVHLETSDGADVLTYKPSKNYQSIAFSSNVLTKGTTYNVYLGGSASGTITDGVYTQTTYTAGTKYTNFTISSAVTKLGNSTGPGGR
jgi:hypothetical protein